jgi:hypothetical protein
VWGLRNQIQTLADAKLITLDTIALAFENSAFTLLTSSTFKLLDHVFHVPLVRIVRLLIQCKFKCKHNFIETLMERYKITRNQVLKQSHQFVAMRGEAQRNLLSIVKTHWDIEEDEWLASQTLDCHLQ